MIQSNTEVKIDCDLFIKQLKIQVEQLELPLSKSLEIDCYQNQSWLMIGIKNTDDKNADSIAKIIDVAKNIIQEQDIHNDYLIFDTFSSTVYFASNDDYPLDFNKLKQPVKKSRYLAGNFSSGFVIFIFSALSIASIGVIYFLTRPCVVDQCELLTNTSNSVNSSLSSSSGNNLEGQEIEQIQTQLVTGIKEINRIPRWSNSYEEGQSLKNTYQSKINELDQFANAEKLIANAENMQKQLPLAIAEWERVKQFITEAITTLESISTSEFNSTKQARIASYQNITKSIDQRIANEKVGTEKLTQAQQIVAKIKENKAQVNSLASLQELELQWKQVIKNIELIPAETTSAKNKDTILNQYLSEIANLQAQITLEKDATNLINVANENIKLAKESQTNNQWSKAVEFWQKAIVSIDKVSPKSLVSKEALTLKKTTEDQLNLAKQGLAKAVKTEEIKQELKTICSGTENICSYQVKNDVIQVLLTQPYFEKIGLLSRSNNDRQRNQLIQHLQQVEKNYQYLSNKYQRKLEVYNFDRKLVMIYQPNQIF